MPELPEVETIVRDLQHVVGRTIRSATLSHADILRGVTRPKLLAGLPGRRIETLHRRAKHAVFTLGDRRLVAQPGMTGSLLVYDRPLTPDEARYAVLRAGLDDGRTLVYRDVRRIGKLLWLDAAGWRRYDGALGPEPLSAAWTAERFAADIATSRQAVKKLLMDQKVVVGIGNIYANEALFAAGVDPSKPGRRVGPAKAAEIVRHARRILEAAIRSQGTTFRDYRTGTGERGNFQLELFVYGREGEPCRVCGTRLAATHDIDARITVFCHRCQR
ncbi:MAG TPA: bifunctional DNA-formamidopyrimidine glycosylase/DNA-(apurinic or apyrimidinic site) lyase [Gemmatimonadales bacterium]|jgi:formamidopyrimidine-DNA glycosylase|nr:bifunctional DNA-formamidopyrimidine glycosylase/DNA-(apurinic or apyrimidinic site) lyase [Gemmatimonadales bacterium]